MFNTKANTTRTYLLTFISIEANNQIKSYKSASLSNMNTFKINHKTPSELMKSYEGFVVQIMNPLITGINCRKIITKSYNKTHNQNCSNSSLNNTNNKISDDSISTEMFPGIEINKYISSLEKRKVLCSKNKLNHIPNICSLHDIDTITETHNHKKDKYNTSNNTTNNELVKQAMIKLKQIAFSLKDIKPKHKKKRKQHKLILEDNDSTYEQEYKPDVISPIERNTARNKEVCICSPIHHNTNKTALTPRNDFICSYMNPDVVLHNKVNKKRMSMINTDIRRGIVKRTTLVVPKQNKEQFKLKLLLLNQDTSIASPHSGRNANSNRTNDSLFSACSSISSCNTYRCGNSSYNLNNKEMNTFTKYNELYKKRNGCCGE